LEKLKFSNHQRQSQTIGDTMNKKTIYAIVAVIVVVLVVGVAGVLLLGGNLGNNGTTPTPTPAPATVVGANTIQFSVNETTTSTGDLVGYSFACKNYNTSTEVVRVDMCISGANYSYILDAGQEKSWASTDGGATWTASSFTTDWPNYGSLFNDFVDRLAAQGNTNDLSYTTDTASITIYCVAVNQTIPDSTFATS